MPVVQVLLAEPGKRKEKENNTTISNISSNDKKENIFRFKILINNVNKDENIA